METSTHKLKGRKFEFPCWHFEIPLYIQVHSLKRVGNGRNNRVKNIYAQSVFYNPRLAAWYICHKLRRIVRGNRFVITDSQHDTSAINYGASCVVPPSTQWRICGIFAWNENNVQRNVFFTSFNHFRALIFLSRNSSSVFGVVHQPHILASNTCTHFFLSNHNKHTSCLPCVRKSILEKDEWMQSVNISSYSAYWNYLCYGFVIAILWHYYVYMCFYRIFSGVLKWRRIKFAKRGNHFPPPYASCSQRGASFLLPPNFWLRIWRSGHDLLRNLTVAVTIGSCFDHLPMLQPLVLASSIGSW